MSVSTRQRLQPRRRNVTQKARVGGQTLHITIGRHEDGRLAELFVDLSKSGSAMRAWSGALALLISLMLQYQVPPDEITDALKEINDMADTKVKVEGDPRITECSGILDYIAQVIRLEGQPAVAPSEEPAQDKSLNLSEGSGF